MGWLRLLVRRVYEHDLDLLRSPLLHFLFYRFEPVIALYVVQLKLDYIALQTRIALLKFRNVATDLWIGFLEFRLKFRRFLRHRSLLLWWVLLPIVVIWKAIYGNVLEFKAAEVTRLEQKPTLVRIMKD